MQCLVRLTHIIAFKTFNTREVNSREHLRCSGHNSAPWSRIYMKLDGNSCYKPPGPFQNRLNLQKPEENQQIEPK